MIHSIIRASGCYSIAACLSLLSYPCLAQQISIAQAVVCVQEAYGVTDIAQAEGDLVPAFSDSEVANLVNTIALRAGLIKNIRTIACDQATYAHAYHSVKADGLPPYLTNQDYIIYNRTKVKSAVGRDKVKAEFLIGHELGHIKNDHLTSRIDLTWPEKEKEADFAGGCAVANMNGAWGPVEEIIYQLRPEVDTNTYPSIEHSLAIALRGFETCGGKAAPKPTPAPVSQYDGIRVLYFEKAGDNGVVDNVLVSEQISYEKGKADNSYPSSGLTCTRDIPYDRVKNLAIKLVKAGVEIYWINRALPELNAVKRITIESQHDRDYYRQKNWEPLTVEQIQCTNSCAGWNSVKLAACR